MLLSRTVPATTKIMKVSSALYIDSVSIMVEDESHIPHPGSVQAAIARTVSRSVALYFARPVRLFRPAKGISHPSVICLVT